MTITVEAVQSGGYTASQDRMGQTALLAKNGLNTVRPGILPSTGGDGAVTALGTPNMSVNVAAVQVAIPDASGGAYLFSSTATVNVAITAANATNPRWDLIIARVYDNEVGDTAPTTPLTLPGGGTTNVQTFTGTIEVVTGVASATPAEPSLPNTRCVVLKRVQVRAATSSILNSDIVTATNQVGRTAAAGGIISCSGSAYYPAAPYDGQYIDDATLGLLRYSAGAAQWKAYGVANRASAAPLLMYMDVNGAAWKGTTWDGVSPLIYHSKTYVVTATGGNWSLTYPTVFPNGIINVHATVGDNSGSVSQLQLIVSTSSLSTLAGTAYSPTGAAVAGSIRVNVTAVGW